MEVQQRGVTVLYSCFNPLTKKHELLVIFDYSKSGVAPQGSLIEAANGKFYGMSGTINKASLFEYTIGEDSVVVRHNFVRATGNSCYGSLLEASSGLLYGMTRSGGDHNSGVLFEYKLSSSTYRVIDHFDGRGNGANPYGELLEASNGKFYAMTYGGGENSQGTLFEYNTSDDSIQVKHHFSNTSGRNPQGSLIQANDGNLYGWTGQSGTKFRYDIAKDTLTTTVTMYSTHGNRPSRGSLFQYFESSIPCSLDTTVTQSGATLTSNATGVSYQWV